MSKEINDKPNRLEADGLSVEYFEAGSGSPIVVFPGRDDDSAEALSRKLAESHRVISLHPLSDDSVSQFSQHLPRALSSLGLERFSVMTIAGGAGAGLALAVAAPERIDRLIMVSPLSLSDAELVDLNCVKAATLVLVGTRDTSDAIEAGRLYREKIHTCHLSLVYGAGSQIGVDRPEASLDSVMQFLEHGEQFIIFRESHLLRA